MKASRLQIFFAARCLAGSLAAASLLVTAAAPAGEATVMLGPVGVGQGKPELRGELRALLRAELSSADFARVKSNEHFTLAATLVRLDSSPTSGNWVRATCVVSVVLLRDGGATLYAVIHGRATADDARAHADAARSDAMRAAVHSAMTRVPQALH